jgi:NADH-quinone oxidoreductase subunit M
MILIFSIILISILVLLRTPKGHITFIRRVGLFCSGVTFFLSCLLLRQFNPNYSNFQFIESVALFNSDYLNLNALFGLDGLSICFVVLTTFLIFLCTLFIRNEDNLRNYSVFLFLLDIAILLTFSTLNIFLFYIFFEFILVPIFLIIGIWGSREKKKRASYLLMFYTVLCSSFMLISIFYIQTVTGTFDYPVVVNYQFNNIEQKFLWLSFFLAFASKIPMFPLHIWLPEAHVEAPTVGSVLLAGILLKLGVYGFLRYNVVLFPEASVYFLPFVYCLSIIGIIYASFIAIRQTDLKRSIAYSSIAHMNLVVMGLFSGNIIAVEGCIVQSISHGFVSSAMFFLIGMLYSQFHSRMLSYYGGLTIIMPVYSVFFIFFTMSNIALPGTSSFVGEYLLLSGIFQESAFASLCGTTGVIFSGAYSLWLANRILFGNFKNNSVEHARDLINIEIFILLNLLLISLFVGVFSSSITDYISLYVVKHNIASMIII